MDAVMALFGAVVGSFLNVCIVRLPARESIVRPGSRCRRCERPLRWYENLPVVSWLALRGRCAGCGARISPMYPLVELGTAVTFVAAWHAFGPTPLLASRLVLLSALIVLALTDLRERLLPNAITLPGMGVGLAVSFVSPPGIRAAVAGVIVGGLVPFIVAEVYHRVRGEEGLGLGDVKMLGMVGGFLGAALALFTLFLASFLGVVVGLPLVLIKRDRKYQIPFGTFLAVSAVVAAFAGQRVIDWYIGLYW
jgi:leader peptidase (prepilin peptidase) / N-methyltransferase